MESGQEKQKPQDGKNVTAGQLLYELLSKSGLQGYQLLQVSDKEAIEDYLSNHIAVSTRVNSFLNTVNASTDSDKILMMRGIALGSMLTVLAFKSNTIPPLMEDVVNIVLRLAYEDIDVLTGESINEKIIYDLPDDSPDNGMSEGPSQSL